MYRGGVHQGSVNILCTGGCVYTKVRYNILCTVQDDVCTPRFYKYIMYRWMCLYQGSI